MRRCALLVGLLSIAAGMPCGHAAEIDVSTRASSLLYYHDAYLPSAGVAIGWTGDYDSCEPGSTSPAYRQSVLDRVNYFRSMAGISADVTLNDQWSHSAQHAALMMSANNSLSHTPPSTWSCYSPEGAEAAGKSNLALGANGAAAIDLYMKDPGAGNAALGHRRWLLYPPTNEVGTGDVPRIGPRGAANALWVIDNTLTTPRPDVRDTFVAWPPPGYVPFTVTYPRWSFSLRNANFSEATVSMTENGQPAAVSVAPVTNGFGDNTLAWIPLGLGHSMNWPRPAFDIVYDVTIDNVRIGGVMQSFSYTVTIFDPDVLLGDFDGNMVVDEADLGRWRANVGAPASGPGDGDANRDGQVDGSDFIIWQQELYVDLRGASSTTIPEPTAAALAMWAAAIGSARRVRNRRLR